MIMSNLTIKIVDSYKEAPNYENDTKLLTAHMAIVVGRGMESGKPSVDIQMTDEEGNKYLIMATGTILEALGQAIAGKRERDNINDIANPPMHIQH